MTVTAAVTGRLGSTFLTPWMVPPVGAELPEKVLFVMSRTSRYRAAAASALFPANVLFATVTK